MKNLAKTLIILALAWLGFVLFLETKNYYGSENNDPSKVIILFGAIVLVAVAIGTLVATTIVPQFGDFIGGYFFNSSQEIEKNPHTDAAAKISQGDYAGAIEEYERIFNKDPTDTFALSEMARVYCEKMDDPAAGADILEQALQHDWLPEPSAFLASRLVDVYWNYQHDASRARAVLLQIAENMPDTKYAANALHRLHEINQAIEE